MSEDAELLTSLWQGDNRFGLLMGICPSPNMYVSSVPSPPHTVQPQAALLLLLLNSFNFKQSIIFARFLLAFGNNEKKQKWQMTHFTSDCLVAWQRFPWKFDCSNCAHLAECYYNDHSFLSLGYPGSVCSHFCVQSFCFTNDRNMLLLIISYRAYSCILQLRKMTVTLNNVFIRYSLVTHRCGKKSPSIFMCLSSFLWRVKYKIVPFGLFPGKAQYLEQDQDSTSCTKPLEPTVCLCNCADTENNQIWFEIFGDIYLPICWFF